MHIPTRITRRKIRILQSELQMLQHYYFEISELLEDYQHEYFRDLEFFTAKAKEFFSSREDEEEDTSSSDSVQIDLPKKFQEYKKTQDGFEDTGARDDNEPEQNKTTKQDIPEWARKLFKKIALMTHPDRVSDDALREELQKTFYRAHKALEDGNFEDLIGVAVELKLDSGLEDRALIPLLETRVRKIKGDISIIENSAEWAWGESLGLPGIRVHMLKRILRERGFAFSEEDLVALISEREKLNVAG